MIYCILKGGLGNMMFQIAATMNMAKIKNTKSCFPNFTKHLEYANKRWHLQYRQEKNKFNKLNDSNEYKKFLRINEKTEFFNNKVKIYKYPFEYSSFIPKEDCFVVDGYFQSEKYFINAREDILENFKPSEDIKKIILKKYKKFLNKKTVSMHIRRGEYIDLANLYNILDISYYEKALNILGEYDVCLVFSDDIQWCKKNLKFKNCHFIENEKDYIEIFLMSMCNNNIISNSSFSWWAAWLNVNKNCTIVAPKKWFEKGYSNLDDSHIIPEKWIKI